MREQGVVASAAGLAPFGHLGWGFRDHAEFVARAAEYISDGLEQNQWVEYVGAASREQLRAELAAMPGVRDRLDSGGIGVTPTMEFYAVPPGSDVVDPQTMVDTWVPKIEKVIEKGYTGYRVVADVTAVARTAEQREAFARYEFLIDQQMAVQPVSALCGYDTTQLGADAAGLICLHPFVNQGTVPFRLYAEPEAGFVLTGEIDAATAELFTATLRCVLPPAREDTVVIDAQGLEFIGHEQLLCLDNYARASGRQVVLRTDQRILTRLVGLIELTNVRLQHP
ncbi:MAG TPA: MEDS domain-containing protein [Mycobacterium sp.]|nr:MEDS domain-containing protein [Mycobacterium sp.]